MWTSAVCSLWLNRVASASTTASTPLGASTASARAATALPPTAAPVQVRSEVRYKSRWSRHPGSYQSLLRFLYPQTWTSARGGATTALRDRCASIPSAVSAAWRSGAPSLGMPPTSRPRLCKRPSVHCHLILSHRHTHTPTQRQEKTQPVLQPQHHETLFI